MYTMLDASEPDDALVTLLACCEDLRDLLRAHFIFKKYTVSHIITGGLLEKGSPTKGKAACDPELVIKG